MHLQRICLTEFRTYPQLSLELSPNHLIFIGPNGVGKSNLLEAIHLLALGIGFRSRSDKVLTRMEHDAYRIEGEFHEKGKKKYCPAIVFRGDQREVYDGENRLTSSSELIGRVPFLLFHGADHELVRGATGVRRRWMDMILSRTSRGYLEKLKKSKIILRQRSALLQTIPLDKTLLSILDRSLVELTLFLDRARQQWIEEINRNIGGIFQKFMNREDEGLRLIFRPSLPPGDFDEAMNKISLFRKKELIYGFSLFGPQRSGLRWTLRGRAAKDYCSEGELRAIAAALKLVISEMDFRAGRHPIFLLDDMMGNFDHRRIEMFLQALAPKGQIIISATSSNVYTPHLPKAKIFQVEPGKVTAL